MLGLKTYFMHVLAQIESANCKIFIAGRKDKRYTARNVHVAICDPDPLPFYCVLVIRSRQLAKPCKSKEAEV